MKEDKSAKKKLIVMLLVLCLMIACLHWLGVGLYSSGSAVSDLKSELKSIYGDEYTEKAVENGTEDMVFEVEPKTWFLTNGNGALGFRNIDSNSNHDDPPLRMVLIGSSSSKFIQIGA